MTFEGMQMSKIDPELIFIGTLIIIVAILWAAALWTANPSGLLVSGLWR